MKEIKHFKHMVISFYSLEKGIKLYGSLNYYYYFLDDSHI